MTQRALSVGRIFVPDYLRDQSYRAFGEAGLSIVPESAKRAKMVAGQDGVVVEGVSVLVSGASSTLEGISEPLARAGIEQFNPFVFTDEPRPVNRK